MPAIRSQDLTHNLVQKELMELIPGISKSILNQVRRMIEPERHRDLSPHIWVFWGKVYPEIFDGVGRSIRFLKRDPEYPGVSRPMHVYEGHKHKLRDFLDLPEDGGIAFVHEAQRLRGNVTEDYFKVFKKLFESKYARNQIVFLSEGPFLRLFPEMEQIKITNKKVDVDWFWPPDEPGQIVTTTTFDSSDPEDVEKAFEVEWVEIVEANPAGLRDVLNDPRKCAALRAAALKETKEDCEDIARGRKPRSACPIQIRRRWVRE